MPFEKGNNTGNWLNLPKTGEKYDYTIHGTITSIEKVENSDHKKNKFNFIKKIKMTTPDGKLVTADEDQGYFYSITFDDGKELKLSSYSPTIALQKAGLTEGVSMKINHPTKGEWLVEIIK